MTAQGPYFDKLKRGEGCITYSIYAHKNELIHTINSESSSILMPIDMSMDPTGMINCFSFNTQACQIVVK